MSVLCFYIELLRLRRKYNNKVLLRIMLRRYLPGDG